MQDRSHSVLTEPWQSQYPVGYQVSPAWHEGGLYKGVNPGGRDHWSHLGPCEVGCHKNIGSGIPAILVISCSLLSSVKWVYTHRAVIGVNRVDTKHLVHCATYMLDQFFCFCFCVFLVFLCLVVHNLPWLHMHKLFLVPYSFFVFHCSRRHLPKYKHRSKSSQAQGSSLSHGEKANQVLPLDVILIWNAHPCSLKNHFLLSLQASLRDPQCPSPKGMLRCYSICTLASWEVSVELPQV